MGDLPAKDLRAILEAVMHLHGVQNLGQFGRFAAETVNRLIRADVVSVTEWSEVNGHRTFFTTRRLWTEAQSQAATRLLPTHPLVVHLAKHRVTDPIALSDVISDRDWRRHPFHREVWGPHGIARSLQLVLPVGRRRMAAVSLDRRGRDFSRRERALLAEIGMHLVATWRRLRQLERKGGTPLPARATFGRSESPAALKSLRLSRRETEVLCWIVEGKQNREIATILGLSLRTVQKHVENLLRQLGAENRHALTVQALRKLAAG